MADKTHPSPSAGWVRRRRGLQPWVCERVIAPYRRGDTARGDQIGRPSGWGRVVVRDPPIRTAGGRRECTPIRWNIFSCGARRRPTFHSATSLIEKRPSDNYLSPKNHGNGIDGGGYRHRSNGVKGPDINRVQAFGSKRCSGISTRTADPVAVTVPFTESSVSTTTLRPLISTSRPTRRNSESGVGSR